MRTTSALLFVLSTLVSFLGPSHATKVVMNLASSDEFLDEYEEEYRHRGLGFTTELATKAPSITTATSFECTEEPRDKFFFRFSKEDRTPIIRSCGWLGSKRVTPDQRAVICRRMRGYEGVPPAKTVCVITCDICDEEPSTKAPSTKAPSTKAPSTKAPSTIPSKAPSTIPSTIPSVVCEEDSEERFLFKMVGRRKIIKKCGWLQSKKVTPDKRAETCGMTKGFRNIPPAKDACLVTCGICGCEDDDDKTFRRGERNLKCSWLRKQKNERLIRNTCNGPAGRICLKTCKRCISDSE